MVTASSYKPRLFDLWLADDPMLVDRRKAGLPQVWVEALPDQIVVRPVTCDALGVWHATRDLKMLRE